MRFTLRSLLTLSRSLRQSVTSGFNSVSAVGLSFFGRGRFDAMPGTPGRIVDRVKAQASVIRDLPNGDMLQAYRLPHENRCYFAKLLVSRRVFAAVRSFLPKVEKGRVDASFACVTAQGVVCPLRNPKGVPTGYGWPSSSPRRQPLARDQRDGHRVVTSPRQPAAVKTGTTPLLRNLAPTDLCERLYFIERLQCPYRQSHQI